MNVSTSESTSVTWFFLTDRQRSSDLTEASNGATFTSTSSAAQFVYLTVPSAAQR